MKFYSITLIHQDQRGKTHLGNIGLSSVVYPFEMQERCSISQPDLKSGHPVPYVNIQFCDVKTLRYKFYCFLIQLKLKSVKNIRKFDFTVYKIKMYHRKTLKLAQFYYRGLKHKVFILFYFILLRSGIWHKIALCSLNISKIHKLVFW